MSQKSRRPGPARAPAEPGAGRLWVAWAAIGGGVVLALAVCILICLSVVRDATRPHGQEGHDHPPGPHGGAVVAVGRENRFHVEAVFERTGQVRVYTYGEDETQVYPVEGAAIPAVVKRVDDCTEFAVSLSPEPQSGDPPGKASRFVGRLPQELDGGRVELVVPAMNFGGERHWFSVKSEGEWHPDPMPEKVTAEEERKLYLTPGGKYTQADITANGGVTASAAGPARACWSRTPRPSNEWRRWTWSSWTRPGR